MAQLHSLHATPHFLSSHLRQGEDFHKATDDHSHPDTYPLPTRKVSLLTFDMSHVKEYESIHSIASIRTSSTVYRYSNQNEEAHGEKSMTEKANAFASQKQCHDINKTSLCRRRSPRKYHARTSLCLPIQERRRSSSMTSIRSHLQRRHTLVSFDTTSANPSCMSRTVLNQIVLRVRGRASDGAPEIIISQKRTLLKRPSFHARNRTVYTSPTCSIPRQFSQILDWLTCQQPLGPDQHGLMLKQLRYVKSVMHEYPWAKARLRDLLNLYTVQNEITKEALFPQLTYLFSHLKREIEISEEKHRTLAQRKQYLTVRLRIASQLVNNIPIIKFGRLGKPHKTYLMYELKDPLSLHWFRKNGEKSEQKIALNQLFIHVNASDDARFTERKRVKVFTMRKCNRLHNICCFSLVSEYRTLELAVQSRLHREWLVSGLKDLIQFAEQYERALLTMQNRETHSLRRM